MKLAIFALAASIAYGSDLTGVWAGQVPGRSSEHPLIDVMIRLVQKGSQISGKLYGETEDLAISKGTIENGKIRLVIDTEGYGGKFQWVFEGAMENGQLVLHRSREDDVTRTADRPKRPPQKITFRKMT